MTTENALSHLFPTTAPNAALPTPGTTPAVLRPLLLRRSAPQRGLAPQEEGIDEQLGRDLSPVLPLASRHVSTVPDAPEHSFEHVQLQRPLPVEAGPDQMTAQHMPAPEPQRREQVTPAATQPMTQLPTSPSGSLPPPPLREPAQPVTPPPTVGLTAAR